MNKENVVYKHSDVYSAKKNNEIMLFARKMDVFGNHHIK
jgi:hypothetical protein